MNPLTNAESIFGLRNVLWLSSLISPSAANFATTSAAAVVALLSRAIRPQSRSISIHTVDAMVAAITFLLHLGAIAATAKH
jgi:hypothetical protein